MKGRLSYKCPRKYLTPPHLWLVLQRTTVQDPVPGFAAHNAHATSCRSNQTPCWGQALKSTAALSHSITSPINIVTKDAPAYHCMRHNLFTSLRDHFSHMFIGQRMIPDRATVDLRVWPQHGVWLAQQEVACVRGKARLKSWIVFLCRTSHRWGWRKLQF